MQSIICVTGLVLLYFLLISSGLLIEKKLHQTYRLEQLVFVLKRDIKRIFRTLISKVRDRYVFDLAFYDEIRGLVKEYANLQFHIQVGQYFYDLRKERTPFVGIEFFPLNSNNDDDYMQLTNIIIVKFKTYLDASGLIWKNFAYYSKGKDFIRILVFYQEYPEDEKGFMARYKFVLRMNRKGDYGMIEDEQLNDEINNIK